MRKSTRDLGVAAVGLVLSIYVIIYNNSRKVDDHIWISGVLIEYNQMGLKRNPALRFTLNKISPESCRSREQVGVVI